MARPILFAVAIIIAVYMPVFFLEGLEGRMFRPMAITVCSALLGSLVLALTVVPAAASVHLRCCTRPRTERWIEWLRERYIAALEWALRRRPYLVAASAAVLAAAVASLAFIGTEFIARLDEGSILIETRKLPGISLTDSVRISNRIEKIILTFPEVAGVVTRIGRPDVATEAMGINQGDVYVLLKPREQWTRFRTKEELINALAAALEVVPGVSYNFTQPMAMRLDETISGIKADVALKIFGEDPRVLERLAEKALRIISAVPGAADEQMEIVSGVAELRIDVDREALARYGLNVSDVQDMMDAAIGGKTVSELIEGQRRFAIVVRLPENYRTDDEAIRSLILNAPGGERVRLGQVARVAMTRGPEVISRENGQRRIVVQCNVRGRDLGGFVAEAQRRLDSELDLPAGYSVDWGGQFENQRRAMRRLMIVVPASILIIFGLLFFTFSERPPGAADPAERPLRLHRRHRRALAARAESQHQRRHRLHRPVRRCRAQRNRAGELHQPPAPVRHADGTGAADRRRHPPPARADDGAGGELRLPSHGHCHHHRSRSAAPARLGGHRRPRLIHVPDALPVAAYVSLVLAEARRAA